jgi:hypothetical protein
VIGVVIGVGAVAVAVVFAVTVAHERGTASPATSNFLGRLHIQARGSGNGSRGGSLSIVTTSLPCMPRRL